MTNAELVQHYTDDVLAGDRIAGKLERWAVQRHCRDLKEAKARGFYFDTRAAERACSFFSLIKHSTGEYAGKPFELDPFQRFIVWSLFGWMRADTKRRRFRRALVELARGNGKSPLAAGITLLCFAYDYPIEARAECFTAATKKAQAKIVLKEVQRYVKQNPDMQNRIRLMSNRLIVDANDSTLEPLGQDSQNQDGLVPHVVCVDELHAWQERHQDLWDKLETALGKRQQPLMLIISTYGNDESEIWEQQHELAVQILDPDCPINLDDWFVFICAIDEEDLWDDEQAWHKANPLLASGVVKIDHLRSMAQSAKYDPVRRNRFERYHLNRKVSSAIKLITPEQWAKGNGELPELEGMDCHGGLDWGWKEDLSALALVFPLGFETVEGEQETEYKGKYAAIVDCWIPEHTKRDLSQEPWASWIQEGWLRVTRGNTTDTGAIYGRVGQLSERYAIRTIGLDPNNCREFGSRIEPEFGIDPFWFGQTHGRYNEPTRELLDAVQEGRLCHGGNPLLGWSAQNVIADEDSRGYIKPDKKRSKDKIDPICALIMALSECQFAEGDGPSVYEGEVMQ